MDIARLYENVFCYRNKKLAWLPVPNGLFALRLEPELTGYVLLHGISMEEPGLCVLLGDRALHDYRLLEECIGNMEWDPEVDHLMAGLDAVQCVFLGKDGLEKAELKRARAYARAHGIRLAGRNAFPQMTRFRSGRVPGLVDTEEDAQRLSMALDAALWLGEHWKECSPAEGDGSIWMLEPAGEGYAAGLCPLPELAAPEYPVGDACNDVTRAQVLKLPMRGAWACEVIRLMVPTPWEGSELPVLPSMLLTADLATADHIPVQPVADYERRTEVMLNVFMNAMLDEGQRPARLIVVDDRTEALLSGWCGTLGIRLARQEYCEALEAVEDQLSGSGDEDMLGDTDEMLDQLLDMSDEELEDMPDFLRDAGRLFGLFGDLDGLPEEMTEKFRALERKLSGEPEESNIIHIDDIRRRASRNPDQFSLFDGGGEDDD
ncbi:MAG: hypothetical protein IJU29_02985 [Oscillospiraceae bacterium]|nr:hypothetical protein [Oscillospiraceae bacterium]